MNTDRIPIADAVVGAVLAVLALALLALFHPGLWPT
jgi:hypothetical protein